MKRSGDIRLNDAVFKVLAVVFTAAVAALLIMSMFIRTELARQYDVITELKSRIEIKTQENARLKIEYESGMSLSELEDYAREKLGMSAPKREQIIKLNVKQDKDDG